VPGPSTEKVAAAAKANSIYVIVGCWEVFGDDTFANTALIFDRSGKLLGKYRKTHAAVDHYEGSPPWNRPPAGRTRDWMVQNDPEWIMEAGKELPVFEFDFGTVGILTCYDGWFPEPARVLSLKGAELLVWINGRRGSVEDFIVKSIMFQSHVAMISTNQAYGGGTMIGDCAERPTQIIARSPDKQESYIVATINLEQIRQARASSRNFRQRRPDLYDALVIPIDELPKEVQ
jgi:predicted amidohydrolase